MPGNLSYQFLVSNSTSKKNLSDSRLTEEENCSGESQQQNSHWSRAPSKGLDVKATIRQVSDSSKKFLPYGGSSESAIAKHLGR